MGFDSQAKANSGGSGRKFIFKDGVRYLHMSGDQPIVFRLLPAFDPANPDPRTSFLPFVNANGELTDWGTFIKVVRFVGHGKGGGTRQDLLSLKTFETPDMPMFCPLDTLYQAINADAQTWGYLTDRGDKADKARPMPAYGKVTSHLVTNVININKTHEGPKLGVFTSSGGNKLIDKKEGLVFQPNPSATRELLAQHYIYGYGYGDITCPKNAPVLVLEKHQNKGEYSDYGITVAKDPRNIVIRHEVGQDTLAQRYNLTKWDDFLNIPTEQELINMLVQLLNGRSPQGYHEHALLKMVFPTYKVPEPPAMPAATPTIAVGFAPSPAAPAIAPVPVYQPTNTVPLPAAPVLNVVPPTPVGYQAPLTVAPAPVPVSSGAALVAPPAPVQEVQGVINNVAAAPAAAPSAAPAQVPGDPVGGFNKEEFLKRVRGG